MVRLKATVGANFAVVVAVVALVGLAGLYITYTAHLDPGTEVETVEDARWSSSGSYEHQSTVVTATAVFEQGAVVRDRSAYFTSVMPILNEPFVYEYQTVNGDGNLDAQINQTLVLRSVGEGNTEYWQTERSLGSTTVEGVGPGDRADAGFAINVTELGAQVAAIEEQLGGTPGQTEITVRSNVTLSGERLGRPVETTTQYEMGIERQGTTYSITSEPQTDSDTLFRQRTVTASYGLPRSIGGPVLLVLSVLALVGLAAGRYDDRFEVTDSERDWIDYVSERAEFEEWITTGHVSDAAMPASRIEVETLAGLADLAIDSNRRVIEDRERGSWLVILDGVAYAYDRPEQPPGVTRPDPLDAATGDTDSADQSEEAD